MKRIAVIESRFGCLHHEADRNEPSTGWCTKGGHCSFENCRYIESLEAHDEKVRAEERAKCEGEIARLHEILGQPPIVVMQSQAVLMKERDALLAERSAVRAAAIDEAEEALFPRGVETTARYSREQTREVFSRLKEGK